MLTYVVKKKWGDGHRLCLVNDGVKEAGFN